MSGNKTKQEEIFDKIKDSCCSFGEARRLSMILSEKTDREIKEFINRKIKKNNWLLYLHKKLVVIFYRLFFYIVVFMIVSTSLCFYFLKIILDFKSFNEYN